MVEQGQILNLFEILCPEVLGINVKHVKSNFIAILLHVCNFMPDLVIKRFHEVESEYESWIKNDGSTLFIYIYLYY